MGVGVKKSEANERGFFFFFCKGLEEREGDRQKKSLRGKTIDT